MKVNVYQLGYTNEQDFKDRDKSKAVCKPMGYVELQDGEYDQEYWADDVWHLLNWGCWNGGKDGIIKKPAGVHSDISCCSSDVILNIDGTSIYKYAKMIGWGDGDSLDDAVEKMRNDVYVFWIFRKHSSK